MNLDQVKELVSSKIADVQEKRMSLSTDLAEVEHHKECTYACCGEHNDFVDFEKCPVCGMTPEIQDQHNDQWWSCVDYVEGNNEECSMYCTIEHFLNEWLEKQEDQKNG